jgi:hypothetical protein
LTAHHRTDSEPAVAVADIGHPVAVVVAGGWVLKGQVDFPLVELEQSASAVSRLPPSLVAWESHRRIEYRSLTEPVMET